MHFRNLKLKCLMQFSLIYMKLQSQIIFVKFTFAEDLYYTYVVVVRIGTLVCLVIKNKNNLKIRSK